MASSRREMVPDRSFRVLFGEGSVAIRSDADLIRLYLDGHGESSEAAFAALIARHGPMVLGVCRRVARDEHAAMDGFQAVFLVLARKAKSVRVDDSLGRWLHAVARRVALRSRSRSTRAIPPPIHPPSEPSDPSAEAIRSEVRRRVALEVARLPAKYREAVSLHHLDGLSQDEAAEALGLPVGTVRSRLSRARDLLRSRLIRQGLAPATYALWFAPRPNSAAVPHRLAELTLTQSGRLVAGSIAPAVLALAYHAKGISVMTKIIGSGSLLVLGALTAGVIALARGDDDPRQPIYGAIVREARREPAPSQPETLEARYRRLIAAFGELEAGISRDLSGATSIWDRWHLEYGASAREVASLRDVVDLAAAHPKDPATRDALIRVLRDGGKLDGESHFEVFGRAVDLLIAHHPDDSEVARVGFDLADHPSRRRDAFFEATYATAKGRETKGLIRLAMALYLESKAHSVDRARHQYNSRLPLRFDPNEGDNLRGRTTSSSPEEMGYSVHTRSLDPSALRSEVERLLGDVINSYADVPYVTTGRHDLERQLREVSATTRDPNDPVMLRLERQLAERPSTLGEVASDRLNALQTLTEGKIAPDFEGVDMDGQSLKLSDTRGKVTVIAFWLPSQGSDGLSMIAETRELAERMKGRPFTLIGVIADGDAEAARRLIESQRMTWPNLRVGGEAIAKRYRVTSRPVYYVLDSEGRIRGKWYWYLHRLDPLIEPLVGEAEAKAAPPR